MVERTRRDYPPSLAELYRRAIILLLGQEALGSVEAMVERMRATPPPPERLGRPPIAPLPPNLDWDESDRTPPLGVDILRLIETKTGNYCDIPNVTKKEGR